jgi:hypothetical protein
VAAPVVADVAPAASLGGTAGASLGGSLAPAGIAAASPATQATAVPSLMDTLFGSSTQGTSGLLGGGAGGSSSLSTSDVLKLAQMQGGGGGGGGGGGQSRLQAPMAQSLQPRPAAAPSAAIPMGPPALTLSPISATPQLDRLLFG